MLSNESVNTINVENEFVNVKTKIVRYSKLYSKPKGPQWKTTYKIPIKNSYLTIKTTNIVCNLIDTKEFKIQIEELL